jgi:hypothetical protein
MSPHKTACSLETRISNERKSLKEKLQSDICPTKQKAQRRGKGPREPSKLEDSLLISAPPQPPTG